MTKLIVKGYRVWGIKQKEDPKKPATETKLSRVFHVKSAAEDFKDLAAKSGKYDDVVVRDEHGFE